MKNIWIALLALAFSGQALAVSGSPGLPLPADVETRLNLSATAGPSVGLGTQVTQKKVNVMKAVYDLSVLSGASGATVKLRDAAGGDAVLPKAAVIKQVIIDTVTALSGTGAPTVALGVNSSTDLKGATAIASYSGIVAGVPVGTAASSVKVTTAAKAIYATIAGGSVVSGKLNVFVEYYLSN